jgi:nucleotide-binding universal stress UspA family protein
MYPRIVVPLDNSDLAERVLPLVSLLGRPFQSSLELLSVTQEIPGYVAPEVTRGEAIALWRAHTEHYLEEISRRLRQQEIPASFKIIHGDVAESIVSEAAQDSSALIAISTHGWAGSSRWNLGSVTLKVLQAANNPVLVVRDQKGDDHGKDTRLENIIVPLDGSVVSEQSLPHALALAKAHSLKLILVRVTPSAWDYYTYMDHTVLHSGDISKAANERAKEYLGAIADQVKNQGATTVEQRIEHGDPASAILEIAEKTPHNLVAMATRGEGSSAGIRWNLGSVAQRVASNSPSPILVIRALANQAPA